MKLFGGDGSGAGLHGVVSKLTSNGMGQQLQSWTGKGQNRPVTGEQIRQAVDPAMLNKIAEQAHISPEEASNQVAQVLPQMVDKAKPKGQMPSADQMQQGLGRVKQMMGSGS